MLRRSNILLFMVAAGAVLSARADVTPSPGYSVSTVLSGYNVGNYDVFSSEGSTYAYGWSSDSNSLVKYSVSNGSVVGNLSTPDSSYTSSLSVFSSFVKYDPSGDGSAWVGFSSDGSDDRIYKVSAAGEWTEMTRLSYNFDIAFYGTEVFVSAGTSPYASDSTNYIYWLNGNAPGEYDSVLFASFDGYSSGLVFSDGDLFTATAGSGANYLLAYGNSDVADFLATTPGDWTVMGGATSAEVLQDVQGNGGGIVVTDDDGNVYYVQNGGAPGTSGLYDEYGNVIATWDGYLLSLAYEGDSFYVAGYGTDGLIKITVPEPGTYALIFGGVACLLLIYRRRKLG